MSDDILQLDIPELLRRFDPEHRLDDYFHLLMEENRRVNLVSRETSRVDFDRLCAESLLPFVRLKGPARGYLDIGSGGGIPALPLVLCGLVEGGVTLVERTARKASALRRIILRLGINAEVHTAEYQSLRLAQPVSVATLRYVKLTKQLLQRILGDLTDDGLLVYYGVPGIDFPGIEQVAYSDTGSETVKWFALIHRTAGSDSVVF